MRILYSYVVGGLMSDDLSPEEEQRKLNRCGQDGWELVVTSKRIIKGTEYIIYYFKRPISDDEAANPQRFNPHTYDFAA